MKKEILIACLVVVCIILSGVVLYQENRIENYKTRIEVYNSLLDFYEVYSNQLLNITLRMMFGNESGI